MQMSRQSPANFTTRIMSSRCSATNPKRVTKSSARTSRRRPKQPACGRSRSTSNQPVNQLNAIVNTPVTLAFCAPCDKIHDYRERVRACAHRWSDTGVVAVPRVIEEDASTSPGSSRGSRYYDTIERTQGVLICSLLVDYYLVENFLVVCLGWHLATRSLWEVFSLLLSLL